MKRSGRWRIEAVRRSIGVLGIGAAVAFGGCGGEEPGAGAGQAEPLLETEQPGAASEAIPRALIVEPAEGAVLDGPTVHIVFAVENIALAPAGDTTPGTGHLHLFVNTATTPPGEVIPAGEAGIIHLGQAQTSYDLSDLAPGEYTVIVVLGDLVHRMIDPQMADTVRFRVR